MNAKKIAEYIYCCMRIAIETRTIVHMVGGCIFKWIEHSKSIEHSKV